MTHTSTSPLFPPLAELGAALAAGRTTSRALVETALERIQDPAGQGAVVFTQVDAEAARAAAAASDAWRRSAPPLSPLMGVPVAIKDLFDIAGQVTRAGSRALAGAAPAVADAAAVQRLRRAGAILIGRTNMTEFAFSGLGLNPHYGTPASPYARAERRIAGGSSSGAAAAVADGMAAVALGTDTGGSVRIPAALCGLTGFKPTASRVPTAGAVPLSSTLDSIGPIGVSVACCVLMHQILSGQTPGRLPERSLKGARIGALSNLVTDQLEAPVARAYDAALNRLSAAGALVSELRFAPLDGLAQISPYSLSGLEAYAWHRPLIAAHAADYDPRVLTRLLKAEPASAADYLELLAARRAMIEAATPVWDSFDAVACPTVAIAPPRIAALEHDDAVYGKANAQVLRNPSIINFLDGCALSLPCHAPGEVPVGLMLSASHGHDERLLALSQAVESALGTRLQG